MVPLDLHRGGEHDGALGLAGTAIGGELRPPFPSPVLSLWPEGLACQQARAGVGCRRGPRAVVGRVNCAGGSSQPNDCSVRV
jgi:hypothetical protein